MKLIFATKVLNLAPFESDSFGSFRKWPICPSLIYYEQRCGPHNHLCSSDSHAQMTSVVRLKI